MVRGLKAIVSYFTFSGNTEEVAELIRDSLESQGIEVDLYEIGYGIVPNLDSYDLRFLGTFTWEYGETPDDVKDFVLDVGYKPDNMFIFGSGDTQFGGEKLFCKAAEKLATFYNSPIDPLKIEQSPRGSQEVLVKEWTNRILTRRELFEEKIRNS